MSTLIALFVFIYVARSFSFFCMCSSVRLVPWSRDVGGSSFSVLLVGASGL